VVAYRLGALICELHSFIHKGLHLIVDVLDLGLAEDGLLKHKVPELRDGVPRLQYQAACQKVPFQVMSPL